MTAPCSGQIPKIVALYYTSSNNQRGDKFRPQESEVKTERPPALGTRQSSQTSVQLGLRLCIKIAFSCDTFLMPYCSAPFLEQYLDMKTVIKNLEIFSRCGTSHLSLEQ
jgi:hypothetical protein